MTIKLSQLDIGLASVDINSEDFLKKNGTSVFVPEKFSEVDIFALLLVKIGHPNGPLTIPIQNGDPDAPFKWDFIFNFDNIGTIHILRSWKNIEVIFKEKRVSEDDLLEFLKFNLKKYKYEISNKKKELEDYLLLVNPYKRHKKISKNARKNLLNVKVNTPDYPKFIMGNDKNSVKSYTDSFSKYMKNMEDEMSYSIILLIHSAYMVESYINLILALFIKDDIKNNKTINKETTKRKWENKLRRLHLDCNFVNPVNMSDPIINNIRNIFQKRNKVAHSSLNIEDITTSNMWFYKNFPILKNPKPFDLYQIAVTNKCPTRQEALNAYKIANETMDFLEKIIDSRVRDDFIFFKESNPVGFNKTTNSYSVPFGQTLVVNL